ncbi:MAG TPA: type II toxin-antitoxin system VapC family toxin [Candidatus Limnocylindrales bacterium]|nr:type II toxin-antitoxin system VapC family toxin [Candidatus Limnocylindrales bacterium]
MIVDASVAAKWFLTDEALVAQADLVRTAMLDRRVSLVAPTILWSEVAHALIRAVRRQRLESEIAQVLSDDFRTVRPLIEEEEVDPHLSVRVALTTGVSAYDAQYLHLGIHLDERIITADQWMLERGRAHGYDVIWLGDITLRDGELVDTPQGYQ